MAQAVKTYIVRDADVGGGGNLMARTFPGTLKGLTEALDDARFRSAAGAPKVVVVVEGRRRRIIRQFDHGREVPVTPAPGLGSRAVANKICSCATKRQELLGRLA
jgi:hypothetical protein